MLFLTVGVAEYCHRFSREAVESPSLEVLKPHLDIVLGNPLWEDLVEQGSSDLQRSLPTSL